MPDLPEGVTTATEAVDERCESPAAIIVAFFSELARLRERIPVLGQRICPAGAIWIAWPAARRRP